MSFTIEEVLQEEVTGARIKVIGVGGGGGNMVNHMIRMGIDNIEFVVANTDAQVLSQSLCENKIQLGEKITRGLGAGMQPEIGRESALESQEEIRASLEGADIVFIAAGLGGGTGTGASPVIAQIARELEALTISVVTKPFSFEGGKRAKLARMGLEELKKESNSIVVIPNDKLLSIVDKNLGIKESFKIVDEVLARAVMGTSGIILSSGENDINVDFADLKTVMSHKGLALMGVGEAQGDKSAHEAITAAVESPLLDDISIEGAKGVLIHFNIHPNYPLMELTNAMEIVKENADPDADVIMGTNTDPSMPEDFVKITLIATGFEKYEEEPQPAVGIKKNTSPEDVRRIQRRVNKSISDDASTSVAPSSIGTPQQTPSFNNDAAPVPPTSPAAPIPPVPPVTPNSAAPTSSPSAFDNPQSLADAPIQPATPTQPYGSFASKQAYTTPKKPVFGGATATTPTPTAISKQKKSMFSPTKSMLENMDDDLDIPTWMRNRNK